MPQQTVKIVMLGDGGVGKSNFLLVFISVNLFVFNNFAFFFFLNLLIFLKGALTIRFVKGQFVSTYDPVTGFCYVVVKIYHGRPLKTHTRKS